MGRILYGMTFLLCKTGAPDMGRILYGATSLLCKTGAPERMRPNIQ